MNYNDLAKELKKHTDVIENTFASNNLQLMRFSYKPYSKDDADCSLLIEFTTYEGTEIPESVWIKVNLYDENDEIYLNESTYISSDNFSGQCQISCVNSQSCKVPSIT